MNLEDRRLVFSRLARLSEAEAAAFGPRAGCARAALRRCPRDRKSARVDGDLDPISLQELTENSCVSAEANAGRVHCFDGAALRRAWDGAGEPYNPIFGRRVTWTEEEACRREDDLAGSRMPRPPPVIPPEATRAEATEILRSLATRHRWGDEDHDFRAALADGRADATFLYEALEAAVRRGDDEVPWFADALLRMRPVPPGGVKEPQALLRLLARQGPVEYRRDYRMTRAVLALRGVDPTESRGELLRLAGLRNSQGAFDALLADGRVSPVGVLDTELLSLPSRILRALLRDGRVQPHASAVADLLRQTRRKVREESPIDLDLLDSDVAQRLRYLVEADGVDPCFNNNYAHRTASRLGLRRCEEFLRRHPFVASWLRSRGRARKSRRSPLRRQAAS